MGALGAHGAGYTATYDGKDYVFRPWTQGMMDAFEEWLVVRLRNDAMDTAEVFRRKARKLMLKANALREENLNNLPQYAANIAMAAKLKEDFEDAAGEAQSLEFEARNMVNQIGENRAQGFYHFFGLLARQSRDQVPGRIKIAHLMLIDSQPKITEEDVANLARFHWHKLGEAITEANEAPKKAPPSPVVAIPLPAATTSESPSISVVA